MDERSLTGGALRPLLSYFCAFVLALLIVAPNIPYSIPLLVNSARWCYLVVVCGLLGVLVCQQKIHLSLKALSIYLFFSCFFSQAPYLSFNAYILVVAALWLFVAFRECDFDIILKILEAAFWLEVILAIMQLAGMDTLLNFGSAIRTDDAGKIISVGLEQLRIPVFFGTVMQYMRFASVLAVLTPFLVLRNKFYLALIVVVCAISQSSTFAMSLIAGCGTYFILSFKSLKNKLRVIIYTSLAVACYAVYDYGSFEGAIDPANGGRLYSWSIIWITWFTDTAKTSSPFVGAFNWHWFLFGHGIDTFLPLFPVYKHDINPFPQAHNCWLQFLWEIGLIGFLLIGWYSVSLVKRLYSNKEHLLIAGLACIATDMFFAFPTRMTQTFFLIVAFLAFCEKKYIDKVARETNP